MNKLKMIGKVIETEEEEVDMTLSEEEKELEKMTFPAKGGEKSVVEKTLDALTEKHNEERNMPSVVGAIVNDRGKTLKLYATTNWNGYFFSNPPESVKDGEIARFTYFGPRGALIYGQEQNTTHAIGYLLAWSMGPKFGRRVYVKCGQLSKVHCDGWEASALKELESSGDNNFETDTFTLGYIEAVIKDATVTFPLGSVSATLGLAPED